jgi:putative DNA methylase
MIKPKKLIEVAMPIKEISAESVQDKYIHHGHISTLHIWWARRPLPVCRAVVFASLVPDPLDENCPIAFSRAVELLIGASAPIKREGQNAVVNVYKPYDDIPHTVVVDKMEDNLRNRLMMFIGKFSDKYVRNEKVGKTTPAKETLSTYSLIKWANKNDKHIIGIARKLIFVAHNSKNGDKAEELLSEYERLYNKIKTAEKNLYDIVDRQIPTLIVKEKEKELYQSINIFLSKMPKVFDPFAGGGAIPLEIARLGCNSFGNDINPVAHIIQRGSCDFPQKYGKPLIMSLVNFKEAYGVLELKEQELKGNIFGETITIENRLAFDINFHARKLLDQIKQKVIENYPIDDDGNRPVAYIWARVGTCSNPTCNADIPLLRQFYLSKKKSKKIFLKPIFNDNKIQFKIEEGECDIEPWIKRGNLKCPCCGNITDVKNLKEQFKSNKTKEIVLAEVFTTSKGKSYKIPQIADLDHIDFSVYSIDTPDDKMHRNSAGGDTFGWGINKWSQLFNKRQLSFIIEATKLCETYNEFNEYYSDDYKKVVKTYLAIWIDRIISYSTSFGRWIPQNEQLTSIFGRQAIAMIFDYPEMMPFSSSTSSSLNQLDWILRYIKEESSSPFSSYFENSTSGEKSKFKENELDATITDPPYYDAIAYADLSDFFYTWLKRSLGNLYPLNFATPQTPKVDECTALKHHRNDNNQEAFKHFENKLLTIFDAIEYQTKDLISIMFAHQSTKAWTTLCNSILGAKMNIQSSWAIDTERNTRMVANSGNALQSSVTVACRPFQKKGFGDFKEVQKEILQVIQKEVKELYSLGYRGADLLTACFGKAVSVFGRYEKVEKSDGSEVTVAELLEMAKEAAFKAIISDIETDDITKFYIGWLNLFGFTEAVHDDVRRITQIGLNLDIDDIYKQQILIKTKDKGKLGTMEERIQTDTRLGTRPVNNATIDIAHRMMFLWKQANRGDLLQYVSNKAPTAESPVWRVLNSLKELLPVSKEQEYVTEILSNQDNLIKESKNRTASMGNQITLDLNN